MFSSIVKTPSLKHAECAQPQRESHPGGMDRNDLLRIALLVLLSITCWCYVTGRTSVAAWQVPLEYGVHSFDGDATTALFSFKSAAENEYIPLLPKNISHLGAPYYCSLSDWPSTDEWLVYFGGLLTKLFGLFVAANAMVMILQVLAAVCFYITARLLNCKWWWAFAGGIVFGFAQFAMARSLHHLTLVNYWHIPFCLLIVGWISRNELGETRGRRYLLVLLASCVIGMQNQYYTNVFLQLTALGAFYQYFRQGWKPVLQTAGIWAATVFGFFLMNVDTLWGYLLHGRNAGSVVRSYLDLELNALRFLDLLVPPPDHSLLGALGQAYYSMTALPGERPNSCYLGLLGIGALGWLAVVSVRRLVAQPARNLPLEAWQVLWILAYSCVGGLNCLAGACGFQLFRATNRYSIFILAIVLLFAVKRLSAKRLDKEMGWTLAGLCAFVALWDQTPPVPTESSIAATARVVDADRQFTRKLEARLPKGAMVFQLPIIDFPEGPTPTVPAYDHFRLYLHSKDLHYSFGAMKGRPAAEWQKELARHSFPEVVHALEAYGFAAVYVNRNGFPDKGEGLLQGFRALGYTEVLESALGDRYCVFIHPNPQPILPAGKID